MILRVGPANSKIIIYGLRRDCRGRLDPYINYPTHLRHAASISEGRPTQGRRTLGAHHCAHGNIGRIWGSVQRSELGQLGPSKRPKPLQGVCPQGLRDIWYSQGYYEFPLAAGTYSIGATAAGYSAKSAVETVGTGDVWESIGLDPAPSAPIHQNIALAGMAFQNRTSAAPGSTVWLGYAVAPGLPVIAFGSAGNLWPSLTGLQAILLGSVPATGTLVVNLSVTGAPSGLTLHTQNYVVTAGQARLSNGDAWIAP